MHTYIRYTYLAFLNTAVWLDEELEDPYNKSEMIYKQKVAVVTEVVHHTTTSRFRDTI